MNATFPPCYNFTEFHRVGSLIVNEEMADQLYLAIVRSKADLDFPALKLMADDLLGKEPDLMPELFDEPCYACDRFLGKITLTFNTHMADLIAQAIYRHSEGGEKKINPALWAMMGEMRNFANMHKRLKKEEAA